MLKIPTNLYFLFACVLLAPTAKAHFPWLLSDPDGHVSLHFGESLDNRTYKLPKPVSEAEIHTDPDQSISMTAIETDQFVGLRSDASIEGPANLHSKIRYGNYHGTELILSLIHI